MRAIDIRDLDIPEQDADYDELADFADKTAVLATDAIEVAPVRRGKWEMLELREPQYDIQGVKTWGMVYRCSECHFLHSVIEDFGHYAYCPNCGAQMEKQDE